MKRSIKRLLLRSVGLSILLGFFGVLFWLGIGEVDEFCRLRTDGGSLQVLDNYRPNVCSDLGIPGDTAGLGELDALQIRDAAARETCWLQAQGANDQAQAGLFGLEASNVPSNVEGASPAPLLSGTGTVANRWYQ